MENYQKNIEDYLSGILSSDEVKVFENRLTSDAEFKDAYEMEVTSRKLTKIAGRHHLKARLNNLDSSKEAKVIQPFFSTKRLLLIASAVVGLFITFLLIQSSTNNDPQKLFATHFQKYRSPALERGDNLSPKSNWKEGIDSYENNRFSEAISAFKSDIPKDQAPEYLVQFYLGQSYLAKEEPDAASAIKAFEKVFGDNFYQEPAKWYMALAYLKLGEIEKAKTILLELNSYENSRQETVQALLKSLE